MSIAQWIHKLIGVTRYDRKKNEYVCGDVASIFNSVYKDGDYIYVNT